MAAKKETETANAVEKVKIKLFKDNGKYKGDVVVGHNGVFYQIQRGVEVWVPRPVAEILQQSMEQDEQTSLFIDQQAAEYNAEASRLGI